MLIDLIVGSALLLFGLYLAAWLLSPRLRARIEQPKYDFLAKVGAATATTITDSEPPP